MGVFGAFPNPSYIQPTQIWLDPLNFGAAGNGTTDDTAAFTSLVSASGASNTGVILRAPFALSNFTFPGNLQIYPVGAGLLKPLANATITLNCYLQRVLWQWLDVTNSNVTINGTPICDTVISDWFGFSATDNTLQFTFGPKLAQLAKVPFELLAKTYKVLSNVYGAGANSQSFNYPSWLGKGGNKTTIDGSGISSGSILTFVGGSGLPLSDAEVRGIGFVANSSVNCLEIAGLGGLRVRDNYYTAYASGVLLNNAANGAFTEFTKIEDCTWNNGTVELEFRRGSGNDSFNESGLYGGNVFNCPSSGTHTCVLIGSGCKPYNAPMNFHIQGNGSTVNAFNNNSTSLESMFGKVKYEMGTATLTQAITNVLNADIDWIGTGSLVLAGTFNQARNILITSSAVVPQWSNREGTFSLVAGSNQIPSNMNQYTREILLIIRNSTNYDYRYKFIIDAASPGTFILADTPTNTTAGTNPVPCTTTPVPYNTVDTLGAGAPTLTVDGTGHLVVTNANYTSGFAAYVSERQIGGTRLQS